MFWPGRYRGIIEERLYLVEFRVEKSQENQNRYAEEGKRAEGEITHNPYGSPRGDIGSGIDIKKPDPPGDKKYQSQYQEKDKHNIFPSIIVCDRII